MLYDQCEARVKSCMTTPLQTLARLALIVSLLARGPAESHAGLANPIRETNAGLGGVVLRVTTLSGDGPGSLRAALDENLSASGPGDTDPDRDPDATSHGIVMRYCLIAEGLSHATHPKGEHSKGTLIHDGVRNVTITGCLYAHNTERNPRLKGSTTATVTNNVMYNWANACVGVGSRGNAKVLKPSETILTGNLAIAGPDTRYRALVKELDPA